MSYSSNWSISGISGLTSLKDCYQWDNVARLNSVGFLRLSDTNPNTGIVSKNLTTSSWIYNPVFPNSQLIKYYGIPNFFIDNKNVFSVGFDDANSVHENAYNYKNPTNFSNSQRSWTDLKQWGFEKFPSIPFPGWLLVYTTTWNCYRLFLRNESQQYYGYCGNKNESTTASSDDNWLIYTEDVDSADVIENAVLTIRDIKRYYEEKLGCVTQIKNYWDIYGGFSFTCTSNTSRMLFQEQTPIDVTINGYQVWTWGRVGSLYGPNEYMYGYIGSSDNPRSNQFLWYRAYNGQSGTYGYYDNAARSVQQGNTGALAFSYLINTYGDMPNTSLYNNTYNNSQVWVPYKLPKYRFYLDGNDEQYRGDNERFFIGTYSFLGDGYLCVPYYVSGYNGTTRSFTLAVKSGGSTSWSSSKIADLQGPYMNYFTFSDKFQNFWSYQPCKDNTNCDRIILYDGATTLTSTMDFPTLFDYTGGRLSANIKRSSIWVEGFSGTPILLNYSGKAISVPIIWSIEPKIWLKEEINSGKLRYQLYLGNFRTYLTADLMKLYNKDFELKLYNSSRTSILCTFSFSPSDFENLSRGQTIKKEYRYGTNGCNLYLLRTASGNDYYCIYLTEVINGTEYNDSAHEFNKTYYLPWNTRQTYTQPFIKVSSSDSTYDPEGYGDVYYAPYYELLGNVSGTLSVTSTIPTDLSGTHTITISGHYTTLTEYTTFRFGATTTEKLIYDSYLQRIFSTYHITYTDETEDSYGYQDLIITSVSF